MSIFPGLGVGLGAVRFATAEADADGAGAALAFAALPPAAGTLGEAAALAEAATLGEGAALGDAEGAVTCATTRAVFCSKARGNPDLPGCGDGLPSGVGAALGGGDVTLRTSEKPPTVGKGIDWIPGVANTAPSVTFCRLVDVVLAPGPAGC